jgi:hypothetical protein
VLSLASISSKIAWLRRRPRPRSPVSALYFQAGSGGVHPCGETEPCISVKRLGVEGRLPERGAVTISGAGCRPAFAFAAGVVRLEPAMILFELLFALMLTGIVLLIFPLLVLLASVAGIVLLWVLAPTVLLAALVLWLVFPHFAGLVLLLLVLAVGLTMLDRRYPRAPARRWQ